MTIVHCAIWLKLLILFFWKHKLYEMLLNFARTIDTNIFYRLFANEEYLLEV